jgi:hypothetical protein
MLGRQPASVYALISTVHLQHSGPPWLYCTATTKHEPHIMCKQDAGLAPLCGRCRHGLGAGRTYRERLRTRIL